MSTCGWISCTPRSPIARASGSTRWASPLFFLPVTLYLTWLSVPFAQQSVVSQEHSSNAGGLILWPIKLMVPIGFALLTLQGVSELIKRVAALQGDVTLDTHYEKPLQ